MNTPKGELTNNFRGTIIAKRAGSKLHPPRLTIKFDIVTSPHGGTGETARAAQIEARVSKDDYNAYKVNDSVDGKIITEEDNRHVFRDLRPAMG